VELSPKLFGKAKCKKGMYNNMHFGENKIKQRIIIYKIFLGGNKVI
jgi:hypothetical protein